MADRSEANIRWTTLVLTVRGKFAQIKLFRQLSKTGILHSVPSLFNRSDEFIRSLESGEGGWVISPTDAFKRQEMVAALTQANVKTADAAVDAACLVFGHSVTDAIASDLIRLVSDVAPQEWMFVASQDVRFN